MRIAITGGIACGKSLFADAMRRLGMEILDADEVVHELESAGGEGVPLLVAAFGPLILDASGAVDRKILGRLVFEDPASLEKINSILHPLVREKIKHWVDRPGSALRGVVIPLLFECGWTNDWDYVICLISSEAVQVERMMQTRGYSEKEARLRIASQMPVAEKAARSQLVVQNDADAASLRQAAARVYAGLMRSADKRG